MSQSEFLARMSERGFVHQCTDQTALNDALNIQPVTAYLGFDCTAPSLHAGSLMPIMLLRHFQQCGHKPIVLLGGGTTKVGDPSGKDQTRQMLDDAAISANMDGIKKIFERYLTFGNGPTDAIIVNNDDWLSKLHYIDFLRDIGPHFSVNRMMSMDSVRLRLEREQHLSFLEFNYMILQAYDFLELYQRQDCRLQFGGSDQWGNIVSGIDLVQRKASGTAFGLTTPLLTTSSGAKMGKTADGAIWLDESRTSSYDFWQYWRNSADADVAKFLRFFTELPIAEIEKLEALDGQAINDAKVILANEVTALCHGRDAAQQAERTAKETFEQGQSSAGLPTINISQALLENGVAILQLLQDAGFANSNGEARRLIRGGGARLNDEKITDENATVDLGAVYDGSIKLSSGKKKHVLIKLT